VHFTTPALVVNSWSFEPSNEPPLLALLVKKQLAVVLVQWNSGAACAADAETATSAATAASSPKTLVMRVIASPWTFGSAGRLPGFANRSRPATPGQNFPTNPTPDWVWIPASHRFSLEI
jgi:hypothetical protein